MPQDAQVSEINVEGKRRMTEKVQGRVMTGTDAMQKWGMITAFKYVLDASMVESFSSISKLKDYMSVYYLTFLHGFLN